MQEKKYKENKHMGATGILYFIENETCSLDRKYPAERMNKEILLFNNNTKKVLAVEKLGLTQK